MRSRQVSLTKIPFLVSETCFYFIFFFARKKKSNKVFRTRPIGISQRFDLGWWNPRPHNLQAPDQTIQLDMTNERTHVTLSANDERQISYLVSLPMGFSLVSNVLCKYSKHFVGDRLLFFTLDGWERITVKIKHLLFVFFVSHFFFAPWKMGEGRPL